MRSGDLRCPLRNVHSSCLHRLVLNMVCATPEPTGLVGRRIGPGSPVTTTPGPATPTAADLEAVLLEAKLSLPPRRPGSVSRGTLIRAARSPEPSRGRCHRAGGLRQVDAAERVGGGGGSAGRVGVTRPLRRRPVGAALGAGVGVRPDGRPPRSGDRGARARPVDAGPSGAAARFGVPDQPVPVRAHARRPARAPAAGVSRRAQRRHLGHTRRVAAGRGESCRAAPPAPAAGVRGRAGARSRATSRSTRPRPSRSSPRRTCTSLRSWPGR